MLSKLSSTTMILLLAPLLVIAQDKPVLKIGGALRFNYNLSSWKDGQKKRGGDFGYEVFKLDIKTEYKGVKLISEYRFYAESFGGGMLKKGWIAYNLNTKDEIQIGLIRVPFGIAPFNSHSWFSSINYYVGLEDDHDMGIKFKHVGEKWKYGLSFLKNAEEFRFGSDSDVSGRRYSYDIGSIDLDGDGNMELRNKEVNQLIGDVLFKFGNEKTMHSVGVSAGIGGIYNLDTKKMGSRYVFACYYDLIAGKFDLKAQVSGFKFHTKNPMGQPGDVIAMTAFAAPYLVASTAISYTLGIGYTIPLNWGLISEIQFYNDFGILDKSNPNFKNSFSNVLGIRVIANSIYTHIDAGMGKDHPWLGPEWTNALASGTPNARWAMRFNINLGYYF